MRLSFWAVIVYIFIMTLGFDGDGLAFSSVSAAVAGGIWFWWKSTRVQRQREKLENMRQEYANSGRSNRDKEVIKRQKKNITELGKIVNNMLDKHNKEIPPRLLDETKILVKLYVDNIEFDKLFILYNNIQNSDANNIYEKLKNFRG